MADHLTTKLGHYTRLSADDRATLAAMATTNLHSIAPRRDIMREGERPGSVNIIVDGWAIRHKMLEDGRRQIFAFLIPGDICDLNIFVLRELDHTVASLTPVTIAQVPGEFIEDMARKNPRLNQALLWDMLVQLAIQREWTVNLGQRSATERIAHLICELFVRLGAAGLCREGRCNIPITQIDLSEATGITPVHVNRTLQELRSQRLIEWKGREVHVPDMEALKRMAMFNDNYLHLGQEGAHLGANE